MIWAARIPVLLAAATSMWFNASYAHSKADVIWQQAGLIAMMVAIDLVKCTFLAAAAHAWNGRTRLRAVTFVLLWTLAFAFSTFCGYAAITTNRHATAAVVDGQAADRARLQQQYDDARADLDRAKASPAWNQTSGCVMLTTKIHRETCPGIKDLQQRVVALATRLGKAPTVTPDPDLKALQAVLPLNPAWTAFLVAFIPAIVLELVASLGAYAVSPTMPSKASEKPTGWFFVRLQRWAAARRKKPSERVSGAHVAAPLKASASRIPKFPK